MSGLGYLQSIYGSFAWTVRSGSSALTTHLRRSLGRPPLFFDPRDPRTDPRSHGLASTQPETRTRGLRYIMAHPLSRRSFSSMSQADPINVDEIEDTVKVEEDIYGEQVKDEYVDEFTPSPFQSPNKPTKTKKARPQSHSSPSPRRCPNTVRRTPKDVHEQDSLLVSLIDRGASWPYRPYLILKMEDWCIGRLPGFFLEFLLLGSSHAMPKRRQKQDTGPLRTCIPYSLIWWNRTKDWEVALLTMKRKNGSMSPGKWV